jgi:hypothetical protein
MIGAILALAVAGIAAAAAEEPVQVSSDGHLIRGGLHTAATATGRQLVIWNRWDSETNRDELWGRMVNRVGMPQGAEFQISRASADGEPVGVGSTAVAARGKRNEFLVVWTQRVGDSGYSHFVGRRIGGDGEPLSDEFALATPGQFARLGALALAHSRGAGEFMIVFSALEARDGDGSSEIGNEIYGARLRAGRAEIPASFQISPSIDAEQLSALNPDVAYNSSAGGYLVVWRGEEPAAGEQPFEAGLVFGRTLLAEPGARIGPLRKLSRATVSTSSLLSPSVAFNPALREYVATWSRPPFRDSSRAYARRILASGRPVGEETYVAGAGPVENAGDEEVAPSGRGYEVVFDVSRDPQHRRGRLVYARRLSRELKRGPYRLISSGEADTSSGAPELAVSPKSWGIRVVWFDRKGAAGYPVVRMRDL